MAKKKISAKTSKVPDRVFEGEIDLHDDTITTMVEWVGEEVVKSNACADMIIAAQSLIRACIEKGKSDAEIQGILDTWKPGTKTSLGPADPVESIMSKFNKMTAEEQAQFQADLLKRLKENRQAA